MSGSSATEIFDFVLALYAEQGTRRSEARPVSELVALGDQLGRALPGSQIDVVTLAATDEYVKQMY